MMAKALPAMLAMAVFASPALFAAPALAQTEEEEAAIRAVALDYIEGWYSGDAERMASALHPELAKRVVLTDPESGQSRIDQMSAMSLVEDTRAGYGTRTPEDIRHSDVAILDVYENAASVRIYASGWVDYLHMAQWNGEWKIVNVLFELHPR